MTLFEITEGTEKGSATERKWQSQQIKGRPEGAECRGWGTPRPPLLRCPPPSLASCSGGCGACPAQGRGGPGSCARAPAPSRRPGRPFRLFNSIQLGLPARKLVPSDIQFITDRGLELFVLHTHSLGLLNHRQGPGTGLFMERASLFLSTCFLLGGARGPVVCYSPTPPSPPLQAWAVEQKSSGRTESQSQLCHLLAVWLRASLSFFIWKMETANSIASIIRQV